MFLVSNKQGCKKLVKKQCCMLPVCTSSDSGLDSLCEAAGEQYSDGISDNLYFSCEPKFSYRWSPLGRLSLRFTYDIIIQTGQHDMNWVCPVFLIRSYLTITEKGSAVGNCGDEIGAVKSIEWFRAGSVLGRSVIDTVVHDLIRAQWGYTKHALQFNDQQQFLTSSKFVREYFWGCFVTSRFLSDPKDCSTLIC